MTAIRNTSLTINFPFVRNFPDYHDIDHLAQDINANTNTKAVRCEEIGFCENGQYWGLFWTGRKPSKAAIKELMTAAKFIPMYPAEYEY